MNMTAIAGRMVTTPKSTMVSIKGKSIFVCYFVVGVIDGFTVYDEYEPLPDNAVDFFQCFSVEDQAKMITENFPKGAKIIVGGNMKNYRFTDTNNTKHFTQILMANTVEFGDSASALQKGNVGKRKYDVSLHHDIREMDRIYNDFLDAGFICLDENDYYYLASGIGMI